MAASPAAVFRITVNGELFEFDTSNPLCAITPTTTLNEFIRTQTTYRGARVSCNEGGCGACAVAVTMDDATIGKPVTRAINSCLSPVLSLNGAQVTTNEPTGITETHAKVQTALAAHSGSQCGFCSSGMVMSMYAMLEEAKADGRVPTHDEIQAGLDGNLCRCTGYRPIIEAFKTFGSAKAACEKQQCCKKLDGKPIEIEDAARTVDPAVRTVKRRATAKTVPRDSASTAVWIDVPSESELRRHLTEANASGKSVMLAVGSTSQALWRKEYDVYLNVGAIPTFTSISQSDDGITFGAAVTLTSLRNYLETCVPPKELPNAGAHLEQANAHLGRVAGTLLRNRASVVGNLVITAQHRTNGDAFPSDAAITLVGLGATITIFDTASSAAKTMPLTDFLAKETLGTAKYVQSVTIPWARPNEAFKSFKIAIRQTLDHAIANAAMKAVVDPASNTVAAGAVVAVGGLFPSPTRLAAVESALVGVVVTSDEQVEKVLKVFDDAVAGGLDPGPGRDAYRRSVARNFMYKFLLSLRPDLPEDLRLATDGWMTKGVSEGNQTFGAPEEALRPVSEAIPKIDGINQCNGTAQYTGDIPAPFGCLHAAVVLTGRANCHVNAVHTAAAAAVPGFVRYLDHTSFANPDHNSFQSGAEEVFVSTESKNAGAFLGLVIAETEDVARHCAALIEAGVEYSAPLGPVIVDVVEARKGTHVGRPDVIERNDETSLTATRTVRGSVRIGSQWCFHLENHSTLARVAEGCVVLDIASQGPTTVQKQVATSLGLPLSDVVVKTRRCGGAFGGKYITPAKTGAVCALAAKVTGRPVKLELSFHDCLRCGGPRPEYLADYEVGLTDEGKMVSLNFDVAFTTGSTYDIAGGEMGVAISNLDNCYYVPKFKATGKVYLSHTPPVQAVRGPGWIQAIGICEMMLNDVARRTGLDPVALREANFYSDPAHKTPGGAVVIPSELKAVWALQHPKYLEAKAAAEEFNQKNKLVKRGVAISPSRFGVAWFGPFNAFVSVYPDGTINIVHGGVEVGQGINTKVAQVCANAFGLSREDVEKHIRIQPNTTVVASGPGNITGSSVTSEMCAKAIMNACAIIKERLEPFLGPDMPWSAAAETASMMNIDMTATGYCRDEDPKPFEQSKYNTWGSALVAVDVDTLTGQFEIRKADLIFDCGVSMNPHVDVGQIEGGFMCGVGWFTSEHALWNPETGFADVAGTWEYKPPAAADVPEVLNVTLLPNSHNETGVLSSKAVGEPPLALAVAVVQAIEAATNAHRIDAGRQPTTVCRTPLTVVDVLESLTA